MSAKPTNLLYYVHGIAPQKDDFYKAFDDKLCKKMGWNSTDAISDKYHWYPEVERTMQDYTTQYEDRQWKIDTFLLGFILSDFAVIYYLLVYGFTLDLYTFWSWVSLKVVSALLVGGPLLFGGIKIGKGFLKSFRLEDKSNLKTILKWFLIRIVFTLVLYGAYQYNSREYLGGGGTNNWLSSLLFVILSLIFLFVYAGSVSRALKDSLIQIVDPLVVEVIWSLKDPDPITGVLEKDTIIDRSLLVNQFGEGITRNYKDHIKNLIIVSHSLGTTIAFDWLFNLHPDHSSKDIKDKFDRIILITMASPISIFAGTMQNKTFTLDPKWRWYNIYDIDDPIARSTEHLVDKSNMQYRGNDFAELEVNDGMLLLSHTSYWKIGKIRSLLLHTWYGITWLISKTSLVEPPKPRPVDAVVRSIKQGLK